jgi:hypothetical protein
MTSALWAQDVPINKQDFNSAFISMKIPKADPRAVAAQKRLDAYMKSIADAINPGLSSSTSMPIFTDAARQILDHAQSTINHSPGFADINHLQSSLQNQWRDLSKSELQKLRDSGVQMPEEFFQSLKNDIKKVGQEVSLYNKEDEIAVISNYMTLEEIPAETLQLKNLDSHIVSFTKDVEQIVVHLHKTPTMKQFMTELEARGEVSGKEELLEFSQIVSTIRDDKNVCWTERAITKLDGTEILLSDMYGKTKDGVKDMASYLLGVETQKDLASINAYKFTEAGVTYYLYQKRDQMNQSSWIMAKLTADGNMSFRNYKIFKEQPIKMKIDNPNDFSLIKSDLQKMTLPVGKKGRIFFQSQEGLVAKSSEVYAPIVGKTMLPDGRLIIGQVQMAYVTPATLTNNQLSVDNDAVRFNTETKPSQHANWAVGGGMRYSPFAHSWQMDSHVRVENLIIGYSDQLNGQKDANVGYILDQNFLSVRTDLQNSAMTTVGRQFKKGKGVVYLSSDFKKINQLKLILFMK